MPNPATPGPGGRSGRGRPVAAERGPTCSTTVIVVTWRGAEHITACLDALAGQHCPHRILVIDNASDDGTSALLARHPSRPPVVRLARNTGYAGALAAALPRVDTPYVAWLNDDAVPEPDWLAVLENTLRADRRLAAVGSHLVLADGSSQSLGVRLTADGHGADLTTARAAFGFCGGAVLIDTTALHSAGGVPESFFCYYEDTDTAWRLRLAGHDLTIAVDAIVRHRHGASTRPGSVRFHRWNERNRLLTLLRCAPMRVAARELALFALRTAVLPFRRAPDAANFRMGLRCRVLADIAGRLPATLRQRAAISERCVAARADIWHRWAGK